MRNIGTFEEDNNSYYKTGLSLREINFFLSVEVFTSDEEDFESLNKFEREKRELSIFQSVKLISILPERKILLERCYNWDNL